MTTETSFPSPKAYLELQSRFVEAMMDAADEIAKRSEQSARDNATTFVNALHSSAERSIDALSVAAGLRARTFGIAREAVGAAPLPSGAK